jgi:hypothetical protein
MRQPVSFFQENANAKPAEDLPAIQPIFKTELR